jgi:cysteine-rich repeat protein
MKAWRPPFYGPRRLGADQDGIVWVPGYGSGVLGRFDPTIERWKIWPMPTGLPTRPGFGTSETPYNLYVNRQTGQVWINGSNSDTLVRFEPETNASRRSRSRRARASRARSSSTRQQPVDVHLERAARPGRAGPRQVREARAAAGRGRVRQRPPRAGEECDDDNTTSCDGCSARCRVEVGCGDGAACDGETCDDGDHDDCDGCSSTCSIEPGPPLRRRRDQRGLRRGVRPARAGPLHAECRREPGCGDGRLDPGEACDDGNGTTATDAARRAAIESGCGDGVVCGAEQCDDGNTTSCDGCSARARPSSERSAATASSNASCGEACDPPKRGPPECNYLCQLGPSTPLGTRHFTFGGALYTSRSAPACRSACPTAASTSSPARRTSAGRRRSRCRVPSTSACRSSAARSATSAAAHVVHGLRLLQRRRGGRRARRAGQRRPGRHGNPIVVTTGSATTADRAPCCSRATSRPSR